MKLSETDRLKNARKLRKKMKKVLTPERLDHTLGVAYTAANMAFVHGCDSSSAMIAGMLHDCAKCIPHEEQYQIAREHGIELTEFEQQNPKLVHAKVGAFLAKEQYGIRDEAILDAIRYHTTGKPDMSTLEEILFVADYIEPNRRPIQDLDEIRREAYTDLTVCIHHILKNTLTYLKTTGDPIDTMTMETYAFYQKKLENQH